MSTDLTQKKLHLVQLVTRMDTGGVPEHVMALLAGLVQHNYQVTVVCREISARYRARLEAMGVAIHLINLQRLISPLADLRACIALFRFLKASRCDILHMHMSKAALLGGIVGALAGVPVRVNTAHNLGCLALRQRILRGVFWLYDHLLFRLCMHQVVTVSSKIREQIIQKCLVKASQVTAIPNGIDAHPFQIESTAIAEARVALNLPPDTVVIGTIARLVWFKGLDTLLAAYAKLQLPVQTCLLIVGDGNLKDVLQQQASTLGIAERVRFLGERTDIPALLACFDVFVLPSVSEGMPITILEAMAARKAVIATDVGGVSELVDDGVTGLLVPSGNPDRLAAALQTVVLGTERRAEMADAGYMRLQNLFSQSSMVDKTHVLYQRLYLESKQGRENAAGRGR